MVFFICDQCGETMKKKQVLQHTYRCRNAQYSCMDCQVVFDKNSYQAHTKCITEAQKYGGVNHVPKVNKGEQKQDAWVTQVRAAIRRVNEPRLKNLLRSVQSHTNIPRKESKFVNFLHNSLRVGDRTLCVDAWNAIKKEADAAAAAAKRTTDGQRAETEAKAETMVKEEENGTAEETTKKAETEMDNAFDNDDGGEREADEGPKTTNEKLIHVQQLTPPLPVKRNKGTHTKFDDE